jgi:DNA repair photolyase
MYAMPYPDRKDVLYYILFSSGNLRITEIVGDIYRRQKNKRTPTLPGLEEEAKPPILGGYKFKYIKRETLLYKTKVEYGNWTINHIIGCRHGCKFPCYAFRMAQKFGWVKDYNEWREPKIVGNALELLEKEIPKYKNEIEFVHLCFMTDPFMYDAERKQLIPEVKDLTLKIIERLNREGIRVTTLTKGIYPRELLDTERFLPTNEYGITLVSLNPKFQRRFEPFSAPYKDRLASLKELADAGRNTWVSLEPYPTPALDSWAKDIERLLESISFVKKIIFGKLNYRRLESESFADPNWKNSDDFYGEMAKKVIEFCEKNDIKYHIKFGTPFSSQKTRSIFFEKGG